MKQVNFHKNLEKNCTFFGNSVSQQIKDFLNADLNEEIEAGFTDKLNNRHDLYFSVLFNGSVYGEFIIGMSREVALQLVEPGSTIDQFENLKLDIFDAFKEILNISAGQTLKNLDQNFEQLTITAPRVTEGRMHLPEIPLYCKRYLHGSHDICFYLYVDQMTLNIAQTYERQKGEIQKNHDTLKEQDLQTEQLKRLNKAKTEFLANMSHELRTPLNGMIGTLEMIKRTSLTESQKSQIDIVEQSGDFLLGIINDILEFSRIESGKLQIEKRKFHFLQSIEKTSKVISSQVYKKPLDLIVDIAENVPQEIVGDETRLRQVLINLIGNSVKFTPRGQIYLRVFMEGHDQVAVEVEDTGVGIPSNRIGGIFDSFAQADVSDNRKYGGSGLGLTICKAIVEAMGGRISVCSEEAKGTTFKFTIPLTEGAFVAPAPSLKNDHAILLLENSSLRENFMRTLFYQGVRHVDDIKFTELQLQKERNRVHVFMDWRGWKSLSEEGRLSLVDQIKASQSFLHLLLSPSEALEVDEYKSLLTGLAGNSILLPLVPTDIQKALDGKTSYSFEAKMVSEPSLSLSLGEGTPILLVEDNPVNQQVAKSLLESLGFSVEVASDGEEAIQKYSPGKFSLILMDCQMPILNGFDASARIRELEKDSNTRTPIIALTASAFRETKERCFESGMDNFVTKPIKRDDLHKVIQATGVKKS